MTGTERSPLDMLVNARLYLNVLWCVYNYYSSYVVGEVLFHFHIVLKDVFGSGYWKLLCVCFNVDSYKPIMYLQFPLDKCHFLVDLDLSETTPLQPRYSRDTARWETLVKRPFLDANRFDVCLCVSMYVTSYSGYYS